MGARRVTKNCNGEGVSAIPWDLGYVVLLEFTLEQILKELEYLLSFYFNCSCTIGYFIVI